MDYRIEKKDELKLLVYSKRFTDETSKEGIPAFWDEYYERGLDRKVPANMGLCVQERAADKEFMYGIGCEAKEAKEVPEGFEMLTIPAYTWAIFKCVGAMPDAIQKMWERIYREWLPGTDYELIQDYDIENYLPGDNQAEDYISEIWLPVRE